MSGKTNILDSSGNVLCTVPATSLQKAALAGKDLRSGVLDEVNLSGADLRRTDLTGASLVKTNLANADLSGAILSDATLRSADLSAANLSGATLRGVSFRSVDLRYANLSCAILRDALFLDGSNLNNAFLGDADMSGARFDATTIFPGGYHPRSYGMKGPGFLMCFVQRIGNSLLDAYVDWEIRRDLGLDRAAYRKRMDQEGDPNRELPAGTKPPGIDTTQSNEPIRVRQNPSFGGFLRNVVLGPIVVFFLILALTQGAVIGAFGFAILFGVPMGLWYWARGE
jgi:hypothetical protein